MPYITPERRTELYIGTEPKGAGELNYSITLLLVNYIQDWGLNYQHINDCIGALEGAKLELYRRVAAPYETTKIEINGDVYPESMVKEPKLKE